ncbi:polymerase [Sphingobacterium spiritivorum]|uniref:polymerase n=1 Tax=Sphingobacterium spiritivorum TaxID=258 RepID=UPI003DA6C9A3
MQKLISKSMLGSISMAVFLLIFLPNSYAQEQNLVQKFKNKFLSSEKDSTRSASFMVLPAAGYAQESGFEYGIAGTYNFYVDKSDPTNRTSSLILMGTMTTKSQKNIKLNSDIWTKNNDYHILSEFRYRDWPFNFYGLGNDTWESDEDKIGQKLFRARIDVEKKITSSYYAGININYEHFKYEDQETGGIYDQQDLIGKTGGQFLAFGISQLFDTRDVTTFTTKGYYARLRYAYAPDFWGNENFRGNLFDIDLRGFYPVSKTLSVAMQGIYRSTFGERIPFYQYRDLGGDNIMRGYYLGRYKDRNYIAGQAELRYRFHPRFGITGFGGTGSTFSKEHDIRLVPSYGAGIRYFFSLEHSSTVRFDYSFGEKRPGEKRQSGFYLSISEAF